MARLFLDTNILIDITEERKNIKLDDFEDHKLFVSPLSIHILTYMYKYKMPDNKLLDLPKQITIISCTKTIAIQSLSGPTKDFEDNVQLHSAAIAQCNIFLTEDKKLLDLKFFGLTKIAPSLDKVN